MWSPDSKKILYTDRKNRIVEVDIASKAKRTVMQNPEGEFYEVNYSPDSQWITYTKSGANNMSVIYVYHLTSGKEYPVTEKWYSSSSPVFSMLMLKSCCTNWGSKGGGSHEQREKCNKRISKVSKLS